MPKTSAGSRAARTTIDPTHARGGLSALGIIAALASHDHDHDDADGARIDRTGRALHTSMEPRRVAPVGTGTHESEPAMRRMDG